MRLVPLALLVVLIASPALAKTVSPADAFQYVGQTVTVEGVVSGVHESRSATFINMGGRYPDNLFTGVVFESDASKVGDVSGLDGKKVDITGTVRLYKGKPEIVIKSAEQIKPAS